MGRIYTYTITEKDLAEAKELPLVIGPYLRAHGYSHRIVAEIKRRPGGIKLNGEWRMVYHPLEPGDVITVTLPDEDAGDVIPADLPFGIVYEDEDILVVDKPPLMAVHPSAGHRENSLANAVAGHYLKRGNAFPFRVINRLDRDTSGLVLVGKNVLSSSILSAQMKARGIHRTYLAVVKGEIREAGTVDEPIARVPGSALMRQVDHENGERAVTHYQPLRYDEEKGLTLLELHLETGRTHQIRVHMGYIGHPLIGDFLYYPDTTWIARQALHSYGLEFTHPITGAQMTLNCPLPEDMHLL